MKSTQLSPKSRNSGKNAKKKGNPKQIIEMDVPRKDVVAFALYTHDHGTLKMSAQLYPLKPGEAREVAAFGLCTDLFVIC